MNSGVSAQKRKSRLFPEMHQAKPWWVPGMLEIKFKEHIRPRVLEPGTKAGVRVDSETGADLSELHRVFGRHHVRKIQPVFSITHQEADEWQRNAREKGHEVQHLGHFFSVHLDAGADVEAAARSFRALPEIEHAAPVSRLKQAALPNDPLLGTSDSVVVIPPTGTEDPLQTQWYIFRCKAEQAWATATGKNIAVAVIDEGFDPNHEDLKPNVAATHNAHSDSATIASSGLPMGTVRHGTAAAGMAAAAGNNGIGLTGFAFDSKLWIVQSPLNVLDVAKAIKWVKDQTQPGITGRVLSISLGEVGRDSTADATLDSSNTIRAIMDVANANNVVICISAGNDLRSEGRDVSTNADGAAFSPSGAIVVAATKYDPSDNTNNSKLPESNWGPRVGVSAPGDYLFDVACTSQASKYFTFFGLTSSACPKVAGTVALMLQVNPNLKQAQVNAILNGSGTYQEPKNFAKPIGPFLNSLAAVQQAASPAGPHVVANRFLNFGKIDQGTPSPAQVLQVFNIGQAPATLSSLNFKDGSNDFTITPRSPFPMTLTPGGPPALFDAVFKPTSKNDVTAAFLLASDDPASPMEIKCTGTAPWNLDNYLRLFAWIAGGIGIVGLIVLILILTHVIKL